MLPNGVLERSWASIRAYVMSVKCKGAGEHHPGYFADLSKKIKGPVAYRTSATDVEPKWLSPTGGAAPPFVARSLRQFGGLIHSRDDRVEENQPRDRRSRCDDDRFSAGISIGGSSAPGGMETVSTATRSKPTSPSSFGAKSPKALVFALRATSMTDRSDRRCRGRPRFVRRDIVSLRSRKGTSQL